MRCNSDYDTVCIQLKPTTPRKQPLSQHRRHVISSPTCHQSFEKVFLFIRDEAHVLSHEALEAASSMPRGKPRILASVVSCSIILRSGPYENRMCKRSASCYKSPGHMIHAGYLSPLWLSRTCVFNWLFCHPLRCFAVVSGALLAPACLSFVGNGAILDNAWDRLVLSCPVFCWDHRKWVKATRWID